MLPTICPVALPGGADWAATLERLGLDVVSSGAEEDDVETYRAARAAVPHRPVLARCANGPTVAALVAEGCRIVCTAAPLGGAYRFHDEDAVVAIDGEAPDVEDVNDVAMRVLHVARSRPAALLWVCAGPGLAARSRADAEAKLAALAEGARQARLWLAKEQFDRD